MESTQARYGARNSDSKGRRYTESAPKFRSEFQRDRDRIIHSGAFRRLEYKTQVFVNHEGDMFRTRLTHSIEVAQIARAIARVLRLNEDLTEAISLAHDLGHTPFGHAGQTALNSCMEAYGGFEHNMQSLRTVEKLERRYADFPGLNLTFETREGILKHCSQERARELGELGERFLRGGQPGLEAQIANVADAIAYNNHDVDDGLRAGLLNIEDLREVALFEEQYQIVEQGYPQLDKRCQIHEIIRRMINCQVVDLIETSRRAIDQLAPESIDTVRAHGTTLIGFSREMEGRQKELKGFLRHKLYRHYRVHRMSVKAQLMVRELFEIFFADSALLPDEYQQLLERQQQRSGETGRARVVADYIAGMTDRFAILEHQKLFHPPHLT